MSKFGSAVMSLGESTYPDAFAGAYATACDTHLTVGVVRTAADSGAFLAAVAANSSADTSYSVIDSTNSWTMLSDLTTTLSQLTWAQWNSYGIDVVTFGPHAPTDTVMITLAAPTAGDLEALESTAQTLGVTNQNVTDVNYVDVAEEIVVALYGSGVSVSGQYLAPVVATSDRYTDLTPFTGGDQIVSTSERCTDGFGAVALAGNRQGDDFTLSAGHCGSASEWDLSGCNGCNGNGTNLGSTSTIWWNNPDQDDFQAILTRPIGGGSTNGYIYYSGSSRYYIEASEIVAPGQAFTFDGSVTGQVRGATAGDATCAYETNYNNVEVCHLIEGYDSVRLCQDGDSGGPSYVVDGDTGGAYAVGTIIGSSYKDGTYYCFAELIDHELSSSLADMSLLLGS